MLNDVSIARIFQFLSSFVVSKKREMGWGTGEEEGREYARFALPIQSLMHLINAFLSILKKLVIYYNLPSEKRNNLTKRVSFLQIVSYYFVLLVIIFTRDERREGYVLLILISLLLPNYTVYLTIRG